MTSQFDWYKLSLLDPQKPEIQKFQAIIRNGNIAKGLQRVPTSYRKNLLTIFQTLSNKIKYETKSMKNVNQTLTFKKNAVANRLQQMQSGLEESKSQLVRMKNVASEKKKMVKKLVQKIETIKKNKTQQTYFCPLCSRNDFVSREIFTFHMFSEHQTYKAEQQNSQKFTIPNNSLSMTANNELKDFIMTLKDKEMEMMKMILGQKKELQTQDLERLYEREMNLMTMKNKSQPQYMSKNKYSMGKEMSNKNYGDDVDLGDDGDEIHGDSQFLFYQKSQKYKQAVEKEEYSLRKALETRKKQLNSHPYYDIFKNMDENKSLNIDAHHLEDENSKRKYFPADSLEDYEQQYSRNENTGYKILSKFNLKSNEEFNSQPKPPVQPLRMTSNNLKFQEFNPSITDRLKEQERKNTHNNSIYSGFGKNTATKGLSTEHEYVFSSGPLVDDNGGHSDYEDYFGEEASSKQKYQQSNLKKLQDNDSINFNLSKETHKNFTIQNNPKTQESLIEDQEIKLNPGSYSFVSRSSYSKNHISELLSPNRDEASSSHLQDSKNPKYKYNMYHNMHDKSSQIVDLSDSFSRRDFELSKDESSINLSDLKLSKLEKKRLEENQKMKFNPKSSSPIYGNQNRQRGSQIEANFSKKPLQFVLVSEQKQFNVSRTNENEQKIDLLSEFQKKMDTPKPLVPQSYSFQKKQTYELNEFYRQPHPPTNFNKHHSYEDSNRSSRLNEFIRNEYSRNENMSPNVQERQQERQQGRALSPQQFFAKQMKKNLSYNSVNQGQLSSNNQQSYVSQSSLSQAPKVNLSQYQRPLSKNKRQSPQSSQNQISEDSGQRSSARNRKKFQRHQELEGKNLQGQGSEGMLNEFFKNEFQGQSSGSSKQNRESSKYKNQNSYKQSQSGSIQNSGSREASQSNSRSISQSYEEGSALDEFIK